MGELQTEVLRALAAGDVCLTVDDLADKLRLNKIQINKATHRLIEWDLAERAELNPKYLGEIERGEKIISIEALMRIAKAVKIPVREFLRDI